VRLVAGWSFMLRKKTINRNSLAGGQPSSLTGPRMHALILIAAWITRRKNEAGRSPGTGRPLLPYRSPFSSHAGHVRTRTCQATFPVPRRARAQCLIDLAESSVRALLCWRAARYTATRRRHGVAKPVVVSARRALG
jgi:hypothetical protein